MTGGERRIPVQLGRVALRWFRRGRGAMNTAVWLFVLAPFTGAMILNVWFAAVGAVVGGLVCFLLMRRSPATDLVIEAGTLRADDPNLDGARVAIDQLVSERSSLALDSSGTSLILVARDGAAATVGWVREDYARASGPEQPDIEPDPVETLAAVHDALIAKPKADRPAPAAAVTAVHCASCGAIVTPDDAPTVDCPYCHAEASVPEALRESVRAARALGVEREEMARTVRQLAVQPTAHAVNRGLLAAATITFGTWIAILVSSAVDWSRGSVSVIRLVVLAGIGLAVSNGVLLMAEAYVEMRHALRTIAFGFAPSAPRAPGTPPCCRTCGAPLDVVDDAVLVRCAYCASDNVLGVAFEGIEARVRSDLRELQPVLSEQRAAIEDARRRSRNGLKLLGAAVLLVLIVSVVRRSV